MIEKSPHKTLTVQTILHNLKKNYVVHFYDLEQLICKILERNDFFLKLDTREGVADEWTINSNYQFLNKSSNSIEKEPQVESKYKQSVHLSYSLKSNQNKIYTGKYSSLAVLLIKLILKSSKKMLTLKAIYKIINKHYSFAYFNLKHSIKYALENLKFFLQVSNEKNIYWTINPEYNFFLELNDNSSRTCALETDKVNTATKKEIPICDSLYEKNVQISCGDKSMSLNKLSVIAILIITAILKSLKKKLTLTKLADFIEKNYDHSYADLKSNVYDMFSSFNFIVKSEATMNRYGKPIVYWGLHSDVKFEFKDVNNSAEDRIVHEDKDLAIRKLVKTLLLSNFLKSNVADDKTCTNQPNETFKFITTDRTLEEVILDVEAEANKENGIQFKTIEKNSDLTNIMIDLLDGKQMRQRDIIQCLCDTLEESVLY